MVDLIMHWEKFMNILIKWLDRFFSYLNRFYVKSAAVEELKLKGMMLFADDVFIVLLPQIIDAFIKEIQKEREGLTIDDGVMR